MMGAPGLGRLLIVADASEERTALCRTFAQGGYETTGAASGREALALLADQDFDLLLTDRMLPEMAGIELVRESLQIDPDLICIVMTEQGTIEAAANAMKAGAFDYLLKPFEPQTLLPLLSRAMEARRLRQENVQLRATVAIYELSRAIALALDSGAILRRIAEGAREQCAADEASVMLPSDAGDTLYVAAGSGENSERLVDKHVAADGSISGWVAEHQEPVTLHGEVDDPRFRSVAPRGGITSASVPMRTGGKLVGVLNVSAAGRHRPFTPGQVKALTILASTGAAALVGERLYQQAQELYQQAQAEIAQRKLAEEALLDSQSRQRGFVRDVLYSVTEGKLQLCSDPADLPTPPPPEGASSELTARNLKSHRRHLQQIVDAQGLSEERGIDIVTAFGEAAMNAVVHGGGGEAWAWAGPEGLVRVWVRDQGQGIGFDYLHRATLERGYTTAGSMGYGFWLMIKTSDRIWLLTGPEGTTLVLEQERVAPESPLLSERLPSP